MVKPIGGEHFGGAQFMSRQEVDRQFKRRFPNDRLSGLLTTTLRMRHIRRVPGQAMINGGATIADSKFKQRFQYHR